MFGSRNQKKIIPILKKALTGMVGYNWGQVGDAAYFLTRAYRDENQELNTFKYAIDYFHLTL